MSKYPKIYLGVDNCFAIKRWVEPKDWISLIKDMGINVGEASFDNEIDFLYSPQWYIDQWFESLMKAEEENNFAVRAFYTGYQSYRTTGFAHFDTKMADNLVLNFFLPVLKKLERTNKFLGLSVHTYPEKVLQDPQKFFDMQSQVIDCYATLVEYSKKHGNTPICVEQMYTPAQAPWTIKTNFEFIEKIYKYTHGPIYTSIDVGHVTGQKKYSKPTSEMLQKNLEEKVPSKKLNIWLGGNSVYKLWDHLLNSKENIGNKIDKLQGAMKEYNYLFSETSDDYNPYKWLEKLAPYSPIIHLQQTDGVNSPHAPFTKENNKKGIIDEKKVLKSIKAAYDKVKPSSDKMPPITKEILLNFEIFSASTMTSYEVIDNIQQSVDYWRKFIPYDGMTIDQIVSQL